MKDVYKTMYHFKKDACGTRTNCGCGCPWGVNIEDDSFHGSHYECKLNEFTEEELNISVNENKEFLKEMMDLSILSQELTWLTK